MNKIKSLYISLSILTAIVFAFIGLNYFIEAPEKLFYFVSFLSPLLYILFFVYLYTKRPSDIEFLKIFMTVILGVCFLIAVGRIFLEDDAGPLPLSIIMITFVFWNLYNRWYAKLSRGNSVLARGAQLPDFTLKNAQGQTVDSASWKGQYNIIVFHRGNWCPFCVAQVRELSETYKEIAAENAQVHFVAPQNEEQTQKLAQRFETGTAHYFDEGLLAAQKLGIVHESSLPFGLEIFGFKSDGVLPTVIITDENMKVLYLNMTKDYRKRPDALQILTRIRGFRGEKELDLAVKNA